MAAISRDPGVGIARVGGDTAYGKDSPFAVLIDCGHRREVEVRWKDSGASLNQQRNRHCDHSMNIER